MLPPHINLAEARLRLNNWFTFAGLTDSDAGFSYNRDNIIVFAFNQSHKLGDATNGPAALIRDLPILSGILSHVNPTHHHLATQPAESLTLTGEAARQLCSELVAKGVLIRKSWDCKTALEVWGLIHPPGHPIGHPAIPAAQRPQRAEGDDETDLGRLVKRWSKLHGSKGHGVSLDLDPAKWAEFGAKNQKTFLPLHLIDELPRHPQRSHSIFGHIAASRPGVLDFRAEEIEVLWANYMEPYGVFKLHRFWFFYQHLMGGQGHVSHSGPLTPGSLMSRFVHYQPDKPWKDQEGRQQTFYAFGQWDQEVTPQHHIPRVKWTVGYHDQFPQQQHQLPTWAA